MTHRTCRLVMLSLGFVLLAIEAFGVQVAAPNGGAAQHSSVSLAEVVRDLPKYVEPGADPSFSESVDHASAEERDAAVPGLIRWLGDERPRVRGLALLFLNFVYLPSGNSRVMSCDRHLPEEDVPVVAARLKDADSGVRKAAFLALGSVETCGQGLGQLVELVLPMLREADVLTEYPDPFFIEADKQMLAKMTPEQQSAFQAKHHTVHKLPAEGPLLLSILTVPRVQPAAAVDDAIIAFLDRPDQTKSTLGESLHTLALSRGSERVNNEALRRVFEEKAMTVFLLQFVTGLRLTPAQLGEQKARLAALAEDASQAPEVREAAATVGACWTGNPHIGCQPLLEQMQKANSRNSGSR